MSADHDELRRLLAEYDAEMATSTMVGPKGRPSLAAYDPAYRAGLRKRIFDTLPALLDRLEAAEKVCEAIEARNQGHEENARQTNRWTEKVVAEHVERSAELVAWRALRTEQEADR